MIFAGNAAKSRPHLSFAPRRAQRRQIDTRSGKTPRNLLKTLTRATARSIHFHLASQTSKFPLNFANHA